MGMDLKTFLNLLKINQTLVRMCEEINTEKF